MTEPVIHRPHCEQPTACQARGAGHCRRCHGRAAAKALHEDPEFKAAASARMKALHEDPEFKAAASARMKALHEDPEFKARMKALHEDPEFKAAASARMKALNAERLAKLGLEPHEAEEWRAIRAKGYTGKEAARIVIRSRREVAA